MPVEAKSSRHVIESATAAQQVHAGYGSESQAANSAQKKSPVVLGIASHCETRNDPEWCGLHSVRESGSESPLWEIDDASLPHLCRLLAGHFRLPLQTNLLLMHQA